jgi:TetR/AcrR family transcriptional repressor of bet genes
MSRQADPSKKKGQIIQAMLYVMSSQGYAGATMPLIAQRAGVQPGSLHYYFEDKQAILIELLNHLSCLILRRFNARKTNSHVAKLAAYIDAHLAYGSDFDPDEIACWLNVAAVAAHDENVQYALQKITAEHITLLESLCENVLQASGRTTNAKREIALSIYAATLGFYHLYISAPQVIAYGLAAEIVRVTASRFMSAQSLSKD